MTWDGGVLSGESPVDVFRSSGRVGDGEVVTVSGDATGEDDEDIEGGDAFSETVPLAPSLSK